MIGKGIELMVAQLTTQFRPKLSRDRNMQEKTKERYAVLHGIFLLR
jgi:hypothetical protein